MGQIWTGLQNSFKHHIPEQYLNGVIDTIFDRLPSGEDEKTPAATPAGGDHDSQTISSSTPTEGAPKKKTVTYDQLYEAILEVFMKINQIPGASWAPPSKDDVEKLLKDSDLDRNQEIDREEFRDFVRKFCGHLVATYAREMLIVTVAVPAAAMLTKRATEGVPKVGSLVSSIPYTVVYATAVAAALLVRYKFFSK